jgi:threonyl-tRNA synthetase
VSVRERTYVSRTCCSGFNTTLHGQVVNQVVKLTSSEASLRCAKIETLCVSAPCVAEREQRIGRQVPMMLHRALFGSLERFMGVLLEHSVGKLAPWLAPEQVRLLPVGEQQLACAEALMRDLNAAEVRACLDISSESLALRIFRAHANSVPFAVIVGNREVESGSATIRERGGQNRTLQRAEAITFLRTSCTPLQ